LVKGETSSAYGGGALHLSNRYVATFIWLDKLGVAAQYGLDVVIRQTIFQGHYALVNKHYEPTPVIAQNSIDRRLIIDVGRTGG
jgi:heparanase 1